MKITERRLRQLIRQVIKESRMNEMESPFGMDSYMGAKSHGDFFAQKVKSWEETANVLRSARGQKEIQEKYSGNSIFVTGLIAMAALGSTALIYGDGAPLAPLAIGTTVAGAISIVSNHFKDQMAQSKHRKNMQADLVELQEEFFSACKKAGGPSKLFVGVRNEHEAFRMFLKQSANFTEMTMQPEDIDTYVPPRSF